MSDLPPIPATNAQRDRWVQGLFRATLVIGLISLLGLVTDMVLVLTSYRTGQAAMEGVALAAAQAVDMMDVDGQAQLELRLQQMDDSHPSAYTLAQDYLDQSGNTSVRLTEIVSDGQRVIVRGAVTAPTLFARWFGVSAVPLSLVASADLNPLRGPTTP